MIEENLQICLVEDVKYYIRDKKDIIEGHLLSGRVWSQKLINQSIEYIETFKLKHLLNVGAHIGTIAIPLSSKIEKVTAVEAHPTTFSYLVENINLNNIKNIHSINVAISNRVEEVKFMSLNNHRTWHNSGGLHVFTPEDFENKSRSYYLATDEFIRESTTIDNLNLEYVDFIIADVEGMEVKLIDGAKNTIKKFRPIIIVEIWDDFNRRLEKMKESFGEVVQIFTEMNYTLVKNISDNYIFFPNEKLK